MNAIFTPARRAILSLAILGTLAAGSIGRAETPDADPPAEVLVDAEPDPLARPTAVVLNYCRASFHRIQKNPSKRVLLEEQEKILNNLNLNPIADAEIIRLYTAVLSEIADIQIADQERDVIRTRHQRAVMHDLAVSALAIGGQVATTQYVGALKTGARSWWDYRTLVFDRDVNLWRLEKSRLVSFVDKSSLFLDTFWKLARKRGIPDQWLVRGSDLDQLESAVNEPRADVRLRVLKRMERFMECYPPYWYYLARTQQALGQFQESLDSYYRLAGLGDQYFRKDEMLAGALANQALIEDYLQKRSAVDTARRALEYSTEVWEVNLMCGVLLLKHGQIAEAEDAILRNLDVNLETQQSLVALLAVYHVSHDARKLMDRLKKPAIARSIPAPLLLECLGVLGTGNIPPATLSQVLGSLQADVDHHFGPDDFRIDAHPIWQLDRAKIALTLGRTTFKEPVVGIESDKHKARFHRIADLGGLLNRSAVPESMVLTLKYPETETLKLHLQEIPPRMLQNLTGDENFLSGWPMLSGRTYRIVAVDVRGQRVVLTTPQTPLPSLVPELPAGPAPLASDDSELPVVPAF